MLKASAFRLRLTILAGVVFGSSLLAQDAPLASLPYTPSLDAQFLNRSADPCTDFYQFACGNWSKLNPIPADQDRWDVYSKLAQENQRYLWGILQQLAKGGAERSANEQKLGDYFQACMDEPAIEAAGADPLKGPLAQIAGLKSSEEFAEYVAAEHRKGVDTGVLFRLNSGPDLHDSSSVIAFAEAGGLGLPDRDYYTKSDAKSVEIRGRYQDHVAQMLQLLRESGSDAKDDAASVMAIETALATHSLTGVEKRDPHNLDHTMGREGLDRMTPAFDWEVYLKAHQVPPFQTVNVTEPNFFAELNRLITEQKLQGWRAYFRWQLVHSYARYLSPRFAEANFGFYGKYLNGVPEMPPRWKTCTRLVDRQLGEALGQVFVARTFSSQTKQQALAMTQQIEATMASDIQNLDWMSQQTKEQALGKLHTIVNKIGYPDRWRDYSTVAVVRSSFSQDVEQASAFEERRTLAKIGKPVDRGEWEMTPPTVDAYYDAQLNDINFPAGVLQPPLFDPKMDAAPNYGNTGATIGHELTHGFDDEGRQFDANGNLKDWWTAADAKQFEARVSCVREQYAGYTVVDDIKINSRLTLGEDVADLGGTLLAYLAWKAHAEPQDAKPMDGFTPEQRFFIGMAQWACGDQRPESKRAHAITDPHSPEQFRIDGVVANLPEFREAFGCKAGQPMARVNACRVW